MTEEKMREYDNFLLEMEQLEIASYNRTGNDPNTIRTLELSNGQYVFNTYPAYHGRVF